MNLEGSAPLNNAPLSVAMTPGNSAAAPEGAFANVLQAASATPEPRVEYIVQPGDNLSQIVSKHLKSLGLHPSTPEIYNGVRELARANGVQNPDLIFPGQRLDLSVLGSQTPPEAGIQVGKAGNLRELVERILNPQAASTTVREPWRGTLAGPARLSSRFGARRDPFTGRERFHHGIDLAAGRGTGIRPFRPGTVTFSGSKAGYGNVVFVRHGDGLVSVYGHNEENLVKTGDFVDARTSLARVGSTGRSTGPHLHFEIRKDGRAIDPLPYLSPTRLAQR